MDCEYPPFTLAKTSPDTTVTVATAVAVAEGFVPTAGTVAVAVIK